MTKQDNGIPLPAQVAHLNGCFTPAAKDRITEYLSAFQSFEPTLGLLYGDLLGVVAGHPSWSIAAFDPQTVDGMVEMYGSFGAVVCYELDGFKVLVPQMAHIGKLDDCELAFKGNRLCSVTAQVS